MQIVALRRLAVLGAALVASACGGKNATGPAGPGTPGTPGTGATPGTFAIDLRWIGDQPNTAVLSAFTGARARWQELIVGDLADEHLTTGTNSIPANACVAGQPALANTTIDDVIIYASVDSIDGSGDVLGQAYPCYIRDNSTVALVGVMKFDEADMQTMVSNGTLGDVITHEMGHVLGLGTLWDEKLSRHMTSLSDTSWIRTTDVRFTGTAGNGAYGVLGGTGGAPIENCASGVPSGCGSGTWLGHWRESTFRNELMTGYISATGNPISRTTLGALTDLGYTVQPSAADTYSLPAAASFSGIASRVTELKDDVKRAPLFTIRNGRSQRLR